MLDLNRVVALVLLAFSSGYLYLAYSYHLLPFERFLAVKPNTMPIGLAIGGIVCSLVILIRPQVPDVEGDGTVNRPEGEYLQTPEELKEFKQFSMCINCLLCYAACPVYGLEEEFVGPAALALGHRYNLDSRDQGQDERQSVIASKEGIWECTYIGECSEVCPKNVDPSAAIQRNKVATTKSWFKSLLMPWGNKK